MATDSQESRGAKVVGIGGVNVRNLESTVWGHFMTHYFVRELAETDDGLMITDLTNYVSVLFDFGIMTKHSLVALL